MVNHKQQQPQQQYAAVNRQEQHGELNQQDQYTSVSRHTQRQQQEQQTQQIQQTAQEQYSSVQSRPHRASMRKLRSQNTTVEDDGDAREETFQQQQIPQSLSTVSVHSFQSAHSYLPEDMPSVGEGDMETADIVEVNAQTGKAFASNASPTGITIAAPGVAWSDHSDIDQGDVTTGGKSARQGMRASPKTVAKNQITQTSAVTELGDKEYEPLAPYQMAAAASVARNTSMCRAKATRKSIDNGLDD
eukprot:scpid99552/ scgid24294/ 